MNIFNKIYYRPQQNLLEFFLKVSLIMRSVNLTALVLFLVVMPKFFKRDKTKLTVLCLGRTIFLDDVAAMEKFSGQLNYLVIHLKYWITIINAVTKNLSGRDRFSEEKYHLGDDLSEAQKVYYDYLSKLLPKLKKLMKFSAILSGNFGYFPQQEIARYCLNSRLPFVVLHKEGLANVSSLENRVMLVKNYHFLGHKLLLYNNTIKTALLSAAPAGLSEEKIAVVGIPRLDYYFHLSAAPNPKRITLFSFYPSDKFFFYVDKNFSGDDKKFTLTKQKTDEFHLWVIKFALAHPDYQVFIKTKYSGHYYTYVKELIDCASANPPLNLVLTNTQNAHELIAKSSVVLGFYSTTQIEALVAGRILVSPYFGDLSPGADWDYFQKHRNLVNYARSQQELDNCLLHADKLTSCSLEERNSFLREFIGELDGFASQRAENEIIKQIKKIAD